MRAATRCSSDGKGAMATAVSRTMLVEKERPRQARGCGNLERIMNSPRWLLAMIVLAAAAGACSSTPHADDPAKEAPTGEKVTRRFFRDPSAVAALTLTDLD